MSISVAALAKAAGPPLFRVSELYLVLTRWPTVAPLATLLHTQNTNTEMQIYMYVPTGVQTHVHVRAVGRN
jgi:hypothetical protein